MYHSHFGVSICTLLSGVSSLLVFPRSSINFSWYNQYILRISSLFIFSLITGGLCKPRRSKMLFFTASSWIIFSCSPKGLSLTPVMDKRVKHRVAHLTFQGELCIVCSVTAKGLFSTQLVSCLSMNEWNSPASLLYSFLNCTPLDAHSLLCGSKHCKYQRRLVTDFSSFWYLKDAEAP